MTTLTNLAKKQEDIRNQVKLLAQESVKPALKEAFEELKKSTPNLTAIRWQQFTPHFNDGEACEFSVYSPDFQFGVDEDFDGFSTWEGYFDKVTGLDKRGFTKAQAEVFVEFSKNLSNIEEMLHVAFDDHAQVTVTADSIEVEEYEHD